MGPDGSGTRIVTQKILEVSGVTAENTTLVNLTPRRAVDALDDGSVDAIFLNFSPDLPMLDTLLNSPKFRPMSFTDADALTRIFPFLVRLVLPRGVIDYQNKVPAADVILIATTNVVLVRKETHPAIIDLLAQTIMEVHAPPGIFQRVDEFPTQSDPEYQMSEEARDFYRNGPSLLNRYLPFWITNYVKRGIALLVAVIAIIIPMFSYGPNLYRWLVQYRMRALYRRFGRSKQPFANRRDRAGNRGAGGRDRKPRPRGPWSRRSGETLGSVFYAEIPPEPRAHPRRIAPHRDAQQKDHYQPGALGASAEPLCQNFSGTNFRPVNDAWSSYLFRVDRFGNLTLGRDTFL